MWILGPFEWVEESENRKFWGDRPLPPDNGGDLTASYCGRNGKILKWLEAPEWDKDGKIYEITGKADMDEPEGCVAAYLYRRVDSFAEVDAILYLGFDDGLVLRLNGNVIFQRFYYPSTWPRQEAIPIHLRKGCNDFLVKIADKDNTSSSCICFDIRPNVQPEQHIRALETLIAAHPSDRENGLEAKVRLVHLYRQVGDLHEADSLAAKVADDPKATQKQKNAVREYLKTRPAGIGEVKTAIRLSDKAAFRTSKGTLYVGFWRDTAPRVTFVPLGVRWPYATSHRPVPIGFDKANSGKVLAIVEDTNSFAVKGDRLSVIVPKDGSGVIFQGGNVGRLLELGMQDEIERAESGELKTFRGPYEVIVFHLNTREGVYGMGHRYDSFNRRGRLNTVGNCDRAFGESHFTLPYFVTQGRDALFINTYGDGEIDVDRESTENVALARLMEDVIDFFYFIGGPKELVRQYVDLTGHTVMPPDWALGVWFSRNSYENEKVVLDVARNLREHKVPAHVLVLEAWREDGDDWMHWNPERWPNHEQMCETLHKMGYNIVLWTMQFHIYNRLKPMPYEKEAFDNRYFCMMGDKPWGYDQGTDKNSYIVDFFNPAAAAWWERQYKPLFDPLTGVDALKTDIGENNAGVTCEGWQNINNIYALGYIRTAWEMTKKLTGHGIVFARTGTVGTQQYPILWAGDHMSWFQGMQEAYNALLSSGLSGYAWTSFDVGGMFGDLDRETYVRMVQMSAFCPIMQCHGQGKREPYDLGDYGEEAVDVFNQYARW